MALQIDKRILVWKTDINGSLNMKITSTFRLSIQYTLAAAIEDQQFAYAKTKRVDQLCSNCTDDQLLSDLCQSAGFLTRRLIYLS